MPLSTESKSDCDSIPFGDASSTSKGYLIFIHIDGYTPGTPLMTCVYSFSSPESTLLETLVLFLDFRVPDTRLSVIDLKLLSISSSTSIISNASIAFCWSVKSDWQVITWVLTAAKADREVIHTYTIKKTPQKKKRPKVNNGRGQ